MDGQTIPPKRTLDLDESVYEFCQRHPEAVAVMQSLGFTEIVKPGMLATVGRYMTLPKGAALRRIDLSTVVQAFEARGFIVTRRKERKP